MIRPEAAATLRRFRDVLAGLALAGGGLWFLSRPGYLLPALGLALLLAGAGLAVIGLRQIRFRGDGEGPGVVRVVEGQIGYFGPQGGGFLALDELGELALTADGAHWRLTSTEGERLTIPRAAKGAEELLDAFVRLPGLDAATLVRAATSGPAPAPRPLWRRAAAPISLPRNS